MRFLAALVVDGALTGALYALVALAFVVVYRASRMINFAVGEWVMLASRFVTFGVHALGLGLPGAVVAASAGMAGLGVACLAVGASTHSDPVDLPLWQVLSAIVALAAATGTWVAWQRPNLGASD